MSSPSDSVKRPVPIFLGRRITIVIIVLIVVGMASLLFIWLASTVSLDKVREQIRSGNVSAAQATLERYLEVHPDDAEGWLLLGQCHEANGKPLEAARAWRQIGQLTQPARTYKRAGFRAAMLLLKSGYFGEGETAALEYLAAFPDSPELIIELYWVYFTQLRERDCQQLLERGLESRPHEFQYLYHLLYGLQKKPVASETVKNLERLEAAVPGQAVVELALGRCYWKLGETERAWQYLHSARRQQPANVRTELVAAEFLLEQDKLQQAKQVLEPRGGREEFLEECRNHEHWWWLRSQLARREGQLEKALEFADAALQLRPFKREYVHGRGAILQASGDHAGAVQAFEEARKLFESDRALYIIVSSGAVVNPTPAVCQEIAGHLDVLGKRLQADGWRHVAQKLEAIESPSASFLQ